MTPTASWFEYSGSGDIVRHSILDPADIEFEPVNHGEITAEDARKHIVDIPTPLEWGCFSFGIVQSEDHFDFYAAIDHVHGDAALIGITMLEAHGMYTSLLSTGQPMALPDAGRFDDFCIQERENTAELTVDSPEVRAWIEFAENNNGSMPEFPLPLGNPLEPTVADMVGEMLLDADQTARFEAACTAAGTRFVGGLYACTAMVEHELTGATTYYGLTPRDTRRTSDNFMTQGWFTGLVPITVPIAATTFAEAAWAAQTSFDSGSEPGAGPVLPRPGIGAVAGQTGPQLSGVELPARRRRSTECGTRGGRDGLLEQYRHLFRRPVLLSVDDLCVPVRGRYRNGGDVPGQRGGP